MVGEELRSNALKQGLWVKAFAEADGDNAKAQAAYIRYRVTELKAARSSDATNSTPIPQGTSSLPIPGWKKTTPRVVIVGTWVMAVAGVFVALIYVLGQDFDAPQSPQSLRSAGQATWMAIVGVGILSAVYARRRKPMWFLIGAGVVFVTLNIVAFVNGIVRAPTLEARFDKNPVFHALKVADPKAYDAALNQYQEGTKNKESKEQLLARLVPAIVAARLKFIPLASDYALVSYWRTQYRYIELMSKSRPDLCYEAFITGTKRPPSGLISDEQRNQELDAFAALIHSSMTPRTQRSHVDAEAVIRLIRARVETKYGNTIENFSDPLASGVDKSKVCGEATMFYNEVFQLRTNEAASVIRLLTTP
jgi:hypothetical protein